MDKQLNDALQVIQAVREMADFLEREAKTPTVMECKHVEGFATSMLLGTIEQLDTIYTQEHSELVHLRMQNECPSLLAMVTRAAADMDAAQGTTRWTGLLHGDGGAQ